MVSDSRRINSSINGVILQLLLVLIFLGNAAFCGKIVKTLPGFDGELPFKLETGYVSVGDSELFYYFVESEGNPKQDPFLLWYSGGPGCSTLNGLIYEIGPLAFNITDYEGGVPRSYYYKYAWTKWANILFVDAPVGTGFSYSTTQEGYFMSDTKAGWQVYKFLRKWLVEVHPRFLRNRLYIGADSYSGISAPLAIQHLILDNAKGVQPQLNIKGYILGSPRTDVIINENSKITFSHRLGFISDELMEALNSTCGAKYYEVDPVNAKCTENLNWYDKNVKDINQNDVLEPNCLWASTGNDGSSQRRSLDQQKYDHVNADQSSGSILLPSDPKVSDFWCHNFKYAMSYWWANDNSVQVALGVRRGMVPDWKRCNLTLNYTKNIQTVVPVHKNLSSYGLEAFIYNGDHDLVVPNTGTETWLSLLNFDVNYNWRPWFIDGQIAGYTVKYERHGYGLTYATVLGAGHPAQEYMRQKCFDMFGRWIHYWPL